MKAVLPSANGTGSKRSLVLLMMFLFAIAMRVGVAEYTLARVAERFPDSELYRAYAMKLFHGEDYEVDGRHALRSPGYPLFLAGVWSCVGEPSVRATLWAQSIVGAFSGLLIYWLTQTFLWDGMPVGSAWAAAFLAMIDPVALALGAFELSETTFTTLLLLAMLSLRGMVVRRSILLGACAGIVFGLAVLIRPSVLLLGPAAGALVLLMPSCRTVRIGAVIVLVTLILTLAPWWIYTARIYGSPVLTTLNVGESLYDGLNPRATGASDFWFKETSATEGMSERDEDKYWRGEALRFAWENPGRVAWLAVVKFGRFWAPWPNEARYRRPWIVAPMAAYFIAVYGFAFLGTWRAQVHRALLIWSLLPAMYFTCLHLVFVSSVRYRSPVMPMVCILTGIGIMAVWNQIGPKRSVKSIHLKHEPPHEGIVAR